MVASVKVSPFFSFVVDREKKRNKSLSTDKRVVPERQSPESLVVVPGTAATPPGAFILTLTSGKLPSFI